MENNINKFGIDQVRTQWMTESRRKKSYEERMGFQESADWHQPLLIEIIFSP